MTLPKRKVIDRLMKNERGFTLVELVIVVALVAMLAAVAVPSYRALVQNNRATAQANELVTSLNLARSEAIKRGLPAAACASVDQSTCSGATNWASGWIVFTDGTGVAGTRDAADVVLQAWQAQQGNPTITGSASSIRYLASGSAALPTNFAVSLPDCTGDRGRAISVSAAGRPRITATSCP